MTLVNNKALLQLREFLLRLKNIGKGRAIEIAGGEFHVTRRVLQSLFERTDLMDRCKESIALARQLQRESSQIGEVFHSSMEEFITENKYNCIVLRYCSGYLDRSGLRSFLIKLAAMLKEDKSRSQRAQQRGSFIIVQDQVQDEDRLGMMEFGQIVRRRTLFEKIFKEANLLVFDQEGPRMVHKDMLGLMTWALCPVSSGASTRVWSEP